MAEISITIGGRPHRIACRDGEEDRVRQLAAMIDERWAPAERAAGLNSERAFLLVALMRRPPVGAAVSDAALARIADRLERLASALEQTPPSA
jgi:cell division protein ZapA